MDAMFASLEDVFETSCVSILTHVQGVDVARQYGVFDGVHEYPYTKPFSIFRPWRISKQYDDVYVLLGNTKGYGYFNVMAFALLSLRANNYWCISPTGARARLNFKSLVLLFTKRLVCNIASVLGLFLSIPIMIVMPLVLVLIRSKHHN